MKESHHSYIMAEELTTKHLYFLSQSGGVKYIKRNLVCTYVQYVRLYIRINGRFNSFKTTVRVNIKLGMINHFLGVSVRRVW